MMKKNLLFTITAGMAFVVLSSNDNGPFANSNGNRTGSAGSTANCSTGGCHASNNTNTSIAITLLDSLSNPVGAYVNGKTYTVRITGTNTSANLPKFGFQLTAVKASDNTTQLGTLATGGTANITLHTTSTPNLIEHTAPLSGTGSGNNWAYSTTCKWTAPSSGSDAVKFFVTLNAVNNNGQTSGDQPNNATQSLQPLSIASLADNADFVIYPNPATNTINLHFSNTTGTYTVNTFDLRGKMIASQMADVNTNNREAHINSEKWASGLYMIQISKDGEQKVFPIVKQ